MTSKTIALVMAFVLSSTMALAQSSQGKAGSDNGPTSNAPTTSGNMNQDTTVRVAKKSKTTKMQKSTTGSSKDALRCPPPIAVVALPTPAPTFGAAP